MTTDVIYVFLGVGLVLMAFLSPKFYWLKLGFSPSDKEAPRWVGRLLFGFCGIVFIVAGVTRLIRGI